ncbi:MAG: cysteine desulfurase [Alphaproteobacteria bacterium]|nr:cysteine desulfurase [Alphaproteobacteria bacterium]
MSVMPQPARDRPAGDATKAFDPRRIRRDFPVFANNPGLVFLDTAASAQKPAQVIDGIAEYYRRDYANVHRGVYRLSARSTELYEEAREKARRFLGAADAREIVFTRGTTEGINLVANAWGGAFLESGDEIILTELEHHSNIVPWQMLRDRLGVKLVVAPVDATGGLDMAAFERLLGPRTRLVATTHIANSTGALLPVASIVRLAHAKGAKVLIDGAQAAPRMPVDVRAIDCDFYVFSGHKTYGPSGIGVLYGKRALLEAMPPWQGGGDMILTVSFAKTVYNELPHKFEAGTPDISGAIGLAIALEYLSSLGLERVHHHEEALTGYGVDTLAAMPGVRLIGAGQRRLGVLSFEVEGVHPHDLATVLDQHQVAVRAGHHCAQPLMEKLGLAATTRASLGVYNDEHDIDALADAIRAAQEIFGS